MHTKLVYLSGAVMACYLGSFGVAHATEAKPAPAAKAATQAAQPAAKPAASAAKSAPAAKTSKTAKSPTKASKTAKSAKPAPSAKSAQAAKPAETAAAAPAKAAAAPVPAQKANPYLAQLPNNPYLANQPANPYLAYRATSPYQPANMADNPVLGLLANSGLMAALQSKATGAPGSPVRKLSLNPLPVDIFMQPNQKPTVAFNTPCIQIQKATNGFPIFTAAETFMFEMAGKVNESNALPLILEPVCV